MVTLFAALAIQVVVASVVSATEGAEPDAPAALWTRLRRIESAFRERDANSLRLSLSTSGKVRVEMKDLVAGQTAYGPGQLQVIFGQIFEVSQTRDLAFDKDDVRVATQGTAFARGRWVRRSVPGGQELVDTLTFTLREETGDWRIQEIRSSR